MSEWLHQTPGKRKELSKVGESWNAKDIPFDYPLSTGVHPPAASRVCQSSERLYTFVEDWFLKKQYEPLCPDWCLKSQFHIPGQTHQTRDEIEQPAQTSSTSREQESCVAQIFDGGILYKKKEDYTNPEIVGNSHSSRSQSNCKLVCQSRIRKITTSQIQKKRDFQEIENSRPQQYW